MSPPDDDVKSSARTTRRYRSPRRRERARQTRERILSAAESGFLTDGYAETSVAAIAAAAAVSVDTVYKAFGGKPGLVRAIFERALEGEGPVPAEQRSDRLQEEEPDPRRIIEGWGRFVIEISPRGSPLLLLARSAAVTDPELRTLLDEVDASRLTRMLLNARHLHESGHLRPDVSVEEAADVMWIYSSAELYELLVIRRGMPVDRYGRFVTEAMISALL